MACGRYYAALLLQFCFIVHVYRALRGARGQGVGGSVCRHCASEPVAFNEYGAVFNVQPHIMDYKAFERFIDQELLISCVRDKPVIWDKTLDIYKDKIAKETAWREICVTLKDDYNVLKPTERHMFERSVFKKWTYTRDAWLRSIKDRMKSTKSGTSVARIKPYKYHDQMLFMEKLIVAEALESIHDVEDTEMTEREITENPNQPTEKRNQMTERNKSETKPVKLERVEKKLKEKPKQTEDRNLTFFKSILPSLTSFSDDEILELHSGVINLVRSIKSARCDRSTGDWSSCAHSSSTPQGYCGRPNNADPLTSIKSSPSPEPSSSEDSE